MPRLLNPCETFKLLVSIANAFPNVSINSYGNTATYNWGSGSLPNL